MGSITSSGQSPLKTRAKPTPLEKWTPAAPIVLPEAAPAAAAPMEHAAEPQTAEPTARKKRRTTSRIVRLSRCENEAFLRAWDEYRERFGECSIEQFIRERCGAATIDDRDSGGIRGARPRR